MILGNPYSFSVFINTIKEWNIDNEFCNGILLFCVDGDFFPKRIVTATLKCEIQPLKEKQYYNIEESRHEVTNVDISEAYITIDELNEIIAKLDIYIDVKFCNELFARLPGDVPRLGWRKPSSL